MDGLRFNVEKPALGDSFNVKITNNSSENLQIKIKDGKDIAASSFYSIEPVGSNSSNTEISLERFSEIKSDNLTKLNSSFSHPRDAANAISFVMMVFSDLWKMLIAAIDFIKIAGENPI